MLDADALADMGMAPAPAETGTPMELRVVSGPDRGKIHRLDDGEYLVGRGLDCHIVLADPAVSRKHFRVVRRGETCEVIDMGGANGTNINGSRASRHALQPGDQIEVGTTVLEFAIQGVVPERAREFPQPEPAPRRSPAIPQKQKSNTGLIIAAAAAGVLVLGGGAVAAWLVMSGDDKPQPTEEAKPEKDVAKMIERAKGLLEDRDWAGAVDQLKEAREAAPDDAEVKGLLAKAHDEVEAEEVITEGKELARKGEFKAAIGRFKEVAQTSEQYADAREELNAAREDFFRDRLGAAKKAWGDGDKEAASKAVDEVLELDEKNAEARLLKEQIASGAAPEKDDGGDKGDDKGEKAEAKDDDKGGDKGGGGGAVGASAKSLMASGLRAYHNREWSAAEAAFSQIANGGFSRKDKSKASDFAAAVKEVGDSNQAATSASSPIKAARAWQKAYKADRRVDGHHGPWLVKQLTAAWVSAADQLYKAKRYPEAAEAAREAMNFDPENVKAMDIDDKCREAAKGMLQKAQQHLDQKNYATARDMARKVMQILGMMDPASQKAREIAIKAQEASSGGDED
ncbi:MAG: hypothetical protein RIT45_2028 [Pseudomonadota bacterium]